MDDTGVAVGTVVAIGSAPVFTGLLARTFAGERLTRRWAAATALGCAGYAVAGKRLMDQGATPEALMASVFSIGAAFLIPLLALVPAQELWSAGGLALALYLGALPTAAAYILFARGLERIGAGETAALAGAALVLAGLALLALRTSPSGGVRARPAEALG